MHLLMLFFYNSMRPEHVFRFNFHVTVTMEAQKSQYFNDFHVSTIYHDLLLSKCPKPQSP